MATPLLCSIPGCDKPRFAREWCTAHWSRWRRHGDPAGGRTPPGEPLSYLRSAIRQQTDECIIWPYSRAGLGYGKLVYEGRREYAHRLALRLTVGEPPSDDFEAAHAPEVCHNPLCINPKHLRWATPAENTADQVRDETIARGEKQWMSVLTEKQVIAIRRDRRSHRVIAKDYGVSRAHIGSIKAGRSWGWLEQSS